MLQLMKLHLLKATATSRLLPQFSIDFVDLPLFLCPTCFHSHDTAMTVCVHSLRPGADLFPASPQCGQRKKKVRGHGNSCTYNATIATTPRFQVMKISCIVKNCPRIRPTDTSHVQHSISFHDQRKDPTYANVGAPRSLSISHTHTPQPIGWAILPTRTHACLLRRRKAVRGGREYLRLARLLHALEQAPSASPSKEPWPEPATTIFFAACAAPVVCPCGGRPARIPLSPSDTRRFRLVMKRLRLSRLDFVARKAFFFFCCVSVLLGRYQREREESKHGKCKPP